MSTEIPGSTYKEGTFKLETENTGRQRMKKECSEEKEQTMWTGRGRRELGVAHLLSLVGCSMIPSTTAVHILISRTYEYVHLLGQRVFADVGVKDAELGKWNCLESSEFAKWYHLGPFWLWSEGEIIRNKKKGQKDEMLLALKMEKRRRGRGEPRNADSL